MLHSNTTHYGKERGGVREFTKTQTFDKNPITGYVDSSTVEEIVKNNFSGTEQFFELVTDGVKTSRRELRNVTATTFETLTDGNHIFKRKVRPATDFTKVGLRSVTTVTTVINEGGN